MKKFGEADVCLEKAMFGEADVWYNAQMSKIQIFITPSDQIIVKDGDIIWVWDSNGNGPMLVSEHHLHGQDLVLISEKNRTEWNRHKYNMQKLWNNRRY